MKTVSIWLAAGLALLPLCSAQAQTVATGAKGMTLYTYDKDAAGKSACYADCAKTWPPYLVSSKQTEKVPKGWTEVTRKGGDKQWAYDAKPVYYFSGDKKAGQTSGDGMGGVWHVIAH